MRWLLGHIAGAAVRFVVGALLTAICIVWGFAPDQWIAKIIGAPPEWVISPWTRLGVVVIGALVVIGLLILSFWKASGSVAPPEFIALEDAAARAMEKSPHLMELWEQFESQPNSVLEYYGQTIAKEIHVYRSMPPSTYVQRVPADGLTIRMKSGRLCALKAYEREPRWLNLQVRVSDLPRILAKVQVLENDWTREDDE